MTEARAYKNNDSQPVRRFNENSPRNIVLGPVESSLHWIIKHVMNERMGHFVRLTTVNSEGDQIRGKDIYPGENKSDEIDGNTIYVFHNRY